MSFPQPALGSRADLVVSSQGLIGQTFPVQCAGGGVIPATQALSGMLIGLRAGDTVTRFHFVLSTVGVGLTLVKCGLYPTAGGAALAASADVSGTINAQGMKTVNAITPYVATTTGVYYVVFLQTFATSGVAILRQSNTVANELDGVNSGLNVGVIMAGQVDLPANAVFASNLTAYWMGVS